MKETRNFVVYKSSAGSGKTYTLVREYIALALTSPGYFRHILAVTFTNKAANEMKQRVVTSLLHLSQPDAFADTSTIKHMMDDLAEKTGNTAAQVSQEAGAVLSSLLHDYDDFAVRTIDSFVSRIIRTFAHDLHLPVDFEIEMDMNTLLDEAVDKLIGKVGLEPDITKILVEFTENKAEEEKSWHIENDLSKVGSHLFSEDSYAYAEKLHEITPSKVLGIVKEIKRFRKEYEESLAVKAKYAVRLIRDSNISNESFYYGKAGIGTFFSNLASGNVVEPNSRVITTVTDDIWYGAKVDFSQKSAIDAIKSQLLALFNDCEKLIENGMKSYLLLAMVSRQIYQLGVISAIELELEVVKQERRVLHVSEFNKRITDIILKEPVPFIYERTGEKYRNYLIDEFQDTSDLQWKNLLPLIANSLASGNSNLVVGDGKQAIYRFRNGQVEQFMLLPGLPASYDPQVFGEAGSALLRNYQPELLNSNFRSLPAIVAFNNDFFHFISGKLDESLRPIYHQQEQKPVPGKNGGLVSIDFLQYDNPSAFSDLNLERIKELITGLQEDGYPLRDIVILTRSNLQGSTVARYLMNQGISVISAEALLLATSPEVNFLVSVLRMLNTPDDPIPAMAVIISLEIWGKLPGMHEKLLELIKNHNYTTYLRENGFEFNERKLRSLPLYDLCEEIIRIFTLDGDPYNPYVQFFLEFVNKFSSKEAIQLPDLLEKWEEKKTQLSVVVPEGVDAVRIMTIHKAKGLEFPVVIWPFATEALKNTRDQLWVEPEHPLLSGLPVALLQTTKDLGAVGYGEFYTRERNKSLLDMINMIYVAFTRPVERLYVLSREVSASKSESISLPPLLKEYLGEAENWETDGSKYTYGESVSTIRIKKPEKEKASGMQGFISVPWQDRIRIATRAPRTWSAGQSPDNQAWGNLVHDVLSKVGTVEDIQAVLELMKTENQLTDEVVETLHKRVSAVLDHPKLKQLFDGTAKVRPEAEIITPEGTLLRPDRVILNRNEATILEFKTESPIEQHALQLNSYAAALERMGLKVRKLLVYIHEEIIVEEI